MRNYLIKKNYGDITIRIDESALNRLKAYTPKGCPFTNYTCFDLLEDWITMYGWQIQERETLIVDFIKNLICDGKRIYKNDLIALINGNELLENTLRMIWGRKNIITYNAMERE